MIKKGSLEHTQCLKEKCMELSGSVGMVGHFDKFFCRCPTCIFNCSVVWMIYCIDIYMYIDSSDVDTSHKDEHTSPYRKPHSISYSSRDNLTLEVSTSFPMTN